ncbi:FadR/GntR family transcriptional regulator [Mycobacterium sp. smrl_JER01]|uniref:FadR/GntR family transcriptional regulator n=1 Tax=Mycobacterium sp. smrl_JER01 TaxID=3402633 RepID=UPI003ACDEECC
MSSEHFTRLPPARSRADHVRDQLAEAIKNGLYPVGAKLPSERELTEALGVSRVSIREGLRSLEAVGLIEVRHGNGYFVTATVRPSVDVIKWFGQHRAEVMDMMLVRGALDELAAAEAAARADNDHRESIRTAHEAFVAAVAADRWELDVLASLDIAFHLAIAEASKSSLLIDLLGELHQHLREARSVGFTPDGRLNQSVAEHQAIFDAIAAGDVPAARAAAGVHITHVRELLSSMESGPP